MGVALGFFVLLSTVGLCCLTGRGPLGPAHPLLLPLPFLFSLCFPAGGPFCVRVPVVCLFPVGGLCRRVRGVLSSGPLVAACRWRSAFSGLALSGRAGRSPGVLSVGPVGVARVVAWLGGFPASVEWVRGFAVVWPSLLLSSVPLGLRVCPSGVERAPSLACSSSFLFVCGWDFPPFPVVYFCGGSASSFLCLSWAGACNGR